MKRYITIFAVFALCCLRCNAQTKVSVHAGDAPLETLLTDEQKNSVTHLTITGKLQEDDYAFIRNSLLDRLEELNLRDAEIDTIPRYAFIHGFSTTKDIRIVLPTALKAILYRGFDFFNSNSVIEFTGDFPYLENRWSIGISILKPSEDNINYTYCDCCNGVYSLDKKVLFYCPSQKIHKETKTINSYTFKDEEFIQFTIPQNVDSIGDYAFQNALVLIPTGFGYSDPLISCEAVIPPKLGKGVFDGSEFTFLYVPDESVELYKNAEGWKDLIIGPISSDIRTLSQAKAMSVKFENGYCILKHDSKTISHIAVYNTGGQKLWTKDAEANEVRIPKQVLTSPFSLLNIHYADGTAETIKIKP